MTGVSEGFADRQPQSGTLDKVVDLVEPFEDLGLTLWGYTITCILTVDVKSLALFTVR